MARQALKYCGQCGVNFPAVFPDCPHCYVSAPLKELEAVTVIPFGEEVKADG